MKIQITTSSFGRAGEKPVRLLKEKNVPFQTNPYGRKLTEEETIEVISDADGVIAGTEPLTGEVLGRLPNLKVISRCGVGLDNVDLEAANKKGITVVNTPDVHVNSVAELALAGILSSMRKIVRGDRIVRGGTWNKPMGSSLYGKSVGVVGFGRVGRQLAKLLKPFSVEISVYDPYVDPAEVEEEFVRVAGLPELLSSSDIITLHIPYSGDTRHLLDRDALKRCKPTVVLVNTARGGIIQEEDLFEFLKENPSSYCYLDVFEQEPYEGPLLELDNIQFTPHIGTATHETREEMEYQAVVNLLKEFKL